MKEQRGEKKVKSKEKKKKGIRDQNSRSQFPSLKILCNFI